MGGWMRLLDYPPIWLAGFVLLTLAVDFGLPMGGFGALAAVARPLGVVLGLAGVGLMVIAVPAFMRHRTTIVPHRDADVLITSGVYARTRNPIYLGDVLILTGVILWRDAVLALPLVPIFAWVLQRRFILPEEARLRVRFGAAFDSYARQTRRWI